jgi:hypothetical protein
MRRRRYSSSASETFGGLVFLLSILTLVFSLVQSCSQDELPRERQVLSETGEVRQVLGTSLSRPYRRNLSPTETIFEPVLVSQNRP